MGRPLRAASGGYVYHVLNRVNAGMPIFDEEEDCDAVERVLMEAVERTATRLLVCWAMRREEFKGGVSHSRLKTTNCYERTTLPAGLVVSETNRPCS